MRCHISSVVEFRSDLYLDSFFGGRPTCMEIPESHSLQLWSWPAQIYLATKVYQEKFSLCCIHDSLFRPASGGRNLTKCVAPAECKQRILRQTGFLMSQSIVCCLWRDPSIALVDAVLVHHSLCAANHGCHIYSTLLSGKITYFDYLMPHLQPLLIGKITHVDYFMPTIKKFEASSFLQWTRAVLVGRLVVCGR
jgi:hypothetical protein